MQTKEIVAAQLMQDDYLFVAGRLYRVGIVNTYMNDTVGIQLYDPNQGRPAKLFFLNLTVHTSTLMQILNQ